MPHCLLCTSVPVTELQVATLTASCSRGNLGQKRPPKDVTWWVYSPLLKSWKLGQETETCTVRARHTSHVTRHDSLSKTSFMAPWRRGRQRKCWMDDIKECTSPLMPGLLRVASCRKGLKRVSAESSVVSPRRPNRSRD